MVWTLCHAVCRCHCSRSCHACAVWVPSPQQVATFEWYFDQANKEGGSTLSGKDTVAFLKTSGLPVDTLRQVRRAEVAAHATDTAITSPLRPQRLSAGMERRE